MNISEYVKMNYAELESEIIKQKKKIKAAQDTIKLLEKLQVAEGTKQQSSKGGETDG